VPDYEASVLESFAQLLRRKSRASSSQDTIFLGSRAVFWSKTQQRIMDETQVEEATELIDCAVAKFPIVDFGKSPGSAHLRELYNDVKMLVFCSEPWKLLGTQVR
jgi:hypothetical protein